MINDVIMHSPTNRFIIHRLYKDILISLRRMLVQLRPLLFNLSVAKGEHRISGGGGGEGLNLTKKCRPPPIHPPKRTQRWLEHKNEQGLLDKNLIF